MILGIIIYGIAVIGCMVAISVNSSDDCPKCGGEVKVSHSKSNTILLGDRLIVTNYKCTKCGHTY